MFRVVHILLLFSFGFIGSYCTFNSEGVLYSKIDLTKEALKQKIESSKCKITYLKQVPFSNKDIAEKLDLRNGKTIMTMSIQNSEIAEYAMHYAFVSESSNNDIINYVYASSSKDPGRSRSAQEIEQQKQHSTSILRTCLNMEVNDGIAKIVEYSN